jgi:class 3 adenylate cyclase
MVTVLFADVAGSTALGEELDPEAVRSLMDGYFAVIRGIIESHGGTVEKFIGDAVMAVFGVPVIHEDDALRAVRAADEIRTDLASLQATAHGARSLTFRTGINTGEVFARGPTGGQAFVTGDPVNTAARLEQAAGPGDILLGQSTYTLVRDAVVVEPIEPVSAKGKTEPVRAYRLVSVDPGRAGHARRLDAPLVGRDRELDRMGGIFRTTADERSCHLLTLLGPAGIGKSRLVAEFAAAAEPEATVLRGRCLSYGEGITYWPIGEIVRTAAGIDDADSVDAARSKLRALLEGEREVDTVSTRVANAIGLSLDPAPQEEVFWAIRKLLERLARDRPLLVVIEDIHWAEPTLLDLIEYIAVWSRDAAILLLCPARPELLDTRPGWGSGMPNSTSLTLEQLDAEATTRLISELPGGTAVPATIAERILTAAEGNPLFVEEMLRMLVDDGLLRKGADGHWQALDELADVRIPASINALLSTRLERLAPEERAVAERASVVGRVFEQAAVAELASASLRPSVGRSLLALVRKELLRPEYSELSAGDAFKFRHILIRDAAYEAVPKAERAVLHERFADWLERTVGDRLAESEEIVGYHLEAAHRYRIELGEGGEPVETLAERAATRLAAAGARAFDRGDSRGAANLAERVLRLRPLLDPRSRRLLPQFIDALIDLGILDAARGWLDQGDVAAAAADDDPRCLVHGRALEAPVDDSR